MDRLRPRERQVFAGFTIAEVEKMTKLMEVTDVQLMNKELFQKVAKSFNCSSGRAGKPVVKWTEVESWFQEKQKHHSPSPAPHCKKEDESSPTPKESGEEQTDLSELEFEARSSKDGAWYDVESFLAHRFLSSGEAEVRVRFIGFGADEDEWINIKNSVRERSVPLDHSECGTLTVGDYILCFQEKRDQAIYYDAHVVEIQRKVHDIRGCRCIFVIRYDHDNDEEKVRLRRLCRRPT